MIHITFEGGDFNGAQLGMAAPYPPPRVLYVTVSPNIDLPVLVVGTEKLPPEPFFKARRYVIDDDRSEVTDDAGAVQGRAIYVAKRVYAHQDAPTTPPVAS